MRTLFIGGTRRGHAALAALLAQHADVCGVISLEQHAHETERYEEPMRSLAAQAGAPCYETRWLKDRDYAALLRDDLRPDVAFVVGCRVVIPPEVYEVPPRGTLAVHDSLLPANRGFAPLNWALLNGADHTGVTLFCLSERTDAGDIVSQERVPIGPDDTAPQVYERVCAATVRLVCAAHQTLLAGELPRIAQDESAATWCCPRTPEDGLIDWSAPTARVYNQVRALTRPYPGAFTYHDGRRLYVWRARPLADAPTYAGRVPGAVVGISREHGTVDVLTGDGVLRLEEVQVAGGDPVAAATVITSIRDRLGLSLPALHERLRRLEDLLAQHSENHAR
ncbi:MAG: methionyl-tRNA formyltransferase [Phycisphaerae bacterium]|jgi:methionyl-tRNA formyltransferase